MAGMTNEVVDGVIAAICNEFPDIPVYDEQVEQALSQPSFFVRSIAPRQRLFLNRRYLRTEMVEVTYFPPDDGRKRNVNDVFEKLFSSLEIIQVGQDMLRGTEMEPHVDDESGVAVFTVNYRYFVTRPRDETEEPEITEIKLKGVTLR